MFSGRPRIYLYSLLGILLVGAASWQWLRPDPREAFLQEVAEMVRMANEGRHTELDLKLSHEARQRIHDEFMPPLQALRLIARQDFTGNRRYQTGTLVLFQEGDYAEIEIERSAPGGAFDGTRLFSVPFIWRHGEWLVAGGFRSDREWMLPE
jgi:hypothetical protein